MYHHVTGACNFLRSPRAVCRFFFFFFFFLKKNASMTEQSLPNPSVSAQFGGQCYNEVDTTSVLQRSSLTFVRALCKAVVARNALRSASMPSPVTQSDTKGGALGTYSVLMALNCVLYTLRIGPPCGGHDRRQIKCYHRWFSIIWTNFASMAWAKQHR